MRTRDYTLNKTERARLIHYLRVAATKFDDDAKLLTGPSAVVTGAMVIGVEFRRQAAEAREIADRLEDADYIRVGHAVE